MKLLVLGATGMVGSHVVRELLARKHQVRVLSRHPDKARMLGPEVEVVTGELPDPNVLPAMYDGVDGVFILNPVGPAETAEGLVAVSGARTARVKRIVYLSVHHLDRAAYLP